MTGDRSAMVAAAAPTQNFICRRILSISDANAPEITKFHASVVTTTESEVTEITET
jgi:hypothetical protein